MKIVTNAPIPKQPFRALIESDRADQGLVRLSAEARQYLIDKLAEALVLDYQQNQAVPQSMVQETSLNHRRAGQGTDRTG